MLEMVLILGNFINDSTFRGNASGFKIDALVKVHIIFIFYYYIIILLFYYLIIYLFVFLGTNGYKQK